MCVLYENGNVMLMCEEIFDLDMEEIFCIRNEMKKV